LTSDEQVRRLIDEIGKLKKQITNLKSKVRRRTKKLEKTFDPLEKARIEFEIEMLKGTIRRWEFVEMKLSLPLIKAVGDLFVENALDQADWTKAGKA
jgi:hypothetical protein